SSTAESSATTSPARTRAPFLTLMAASWPPTSGAMRTSVVRTTPTTGSAGRGRHRRYPPMPATTRIRASTMMPRTVRLAMRTPPLDDNRGNHREREIDDGQAPQAAPVARDFPQARAQLIDANDAVDGEIRREYVTRDQHRMGNCFARPRKARQEKLRKARAEDDEGRGLRVLEPGARCLGHEAGREGEQRREREQLQRMAEGGKPVDARQHDEVERERGEIDRQVRDAAAEHARERSVGALRQRDD